MKKRLYITNLILSGVVLGTVTLCGCSGCRSKEADAEGVIYHGADVPEESTSSETSASETAETVSKTSEVHTETSEAASTQDTTAAKSDGVKYQPPAVINQRSTSFGDMGCGGAAALMAMQAIGLYTDIDTDEEYADFWSTVPKSYNPNKGWSNNYGIWNPAYSAWVDDYTNAERVQNYSTDVIKKYLESGSTFIPLVSLGDSGNYTHWFTVYGYYESDGVTYYYVADPWGGGLREYTESKLNEKIQEAARRKGNLGFGYETEGVAVSK